MQFLKPKMFFRPYSLLEPFPLSIIEIISQKVQAQHLAKLEAVQKYFKEIATKPNTNYSLNISPSYWINPHKKCPNNPEPCNHQKYRNHCVHTLDFLILKASIKLHRYTQVALMVNQERIVLTPQFLMDCGFLKEF